MRYLSVCSGIEAASVAWESLGWNPVAFSEIEPFPSAVLAHRFPHIPNLGDMTNFKEWPDDLAPDILVGGTPCQSFSVAGLRAGLADPRGSLMLTYLTIAGAYQPRWVAWENVPGVLSSNGGRDFAALLQGLAQLGYGFAYRILDAQYFGVPQRRRRVFVVGHLGDWRAAAAVLFERHSLSGHPAPSRKAGETVAGTIAKCSFSGGAGGRPEGAAGNHFLPTLLGGIDYENNGHGADEPTGPLLKGSPTGGGKPLPVICMSTGQAEDAASTMRSQQGGEGYAVMTPNMQVRRLTPTECERLQGFPDGYTDVPYRNKPAADGPRYKALGNSMAVPVMKWIGERINMVTNS